tara:strand:+ start:71 stop:307 length:237 start_codon:yes stop_codon:yes gene_type:complete
MRIGIPLILFFLLLGCSEDNKADKTTESGAETHATKEKTIPTLTLPNQEEKKPEQHFSGGSKNHISGATPTTKHMSGQ